MQEGSLRCDVNLSIRPKGSTELGTRTEMKNLSSFKAIARAIGYEAGRQQERIELDGQPVIQETRRWDEDKDASFSMRSKENARDYRYFPEPDIPPAVLSEEDLARLKASLPEPAQSRKARYIRDFGLSEYDAGLLTGTKALSDFFEQTVALGVHPTQAAHWIMSDLLRLLKEHGIAPKEMKFAPETLASIVGMVSQGKLNRGTASKVFQAVFEHNEDPAAYVKAHGLEQITDTTLVERAVRDVLAANPVQTAEYRKGKVKLFGFFFGQCMRSLNGKADPQQVRLVLSAQLGQVP